MRAHISLLLAVAAVTGGLAACGQSEESKVRGTLAQLARATAKKDYRTLCQKVFAPSLVARIATIGLPCDRAMGIGLADVQRPRLRVLSVTVDGNQADARVRSTARGEKASVDTIHLIKQKGEWRVSSLVVPGPPH